jgi:hypothetical protein
MRPVRPVSWLDLDVADPLLSLIPLWVSTTNGCFVAAAGADRLRALRSATDFNITSARGVQLCLARMLEVCQWLDVTTRKPLDCSAVISRHATVQPRTLRVGTERRPSKLELLQKQRAAASAPHRRTSQLEDALCPYRPRVCRSVAGSSAYYECIPERGWSGLVVVDDILTASRLRSSKSRIESMSRSSLNYVHQSAFAPPAPRSWLAETGQLRPTTFCTHGVAAATR